MRRLGADAAATVTEIDGTRKAAEATGTERNAHVDDLVLPAVAAVGDVL